MHLHLLIKKALRSASLLVLLLVAGIAVNGALLGYAVFSLADSYSEENISLYASKLERSGNGYSLSPELEATLSESGKWLMLLDENGNAVYTANCPPELPGHYSLPDVAKFTRWYLLDYPVRVWTYEDELLVMGAPKNTVWKYNYEAQMPTLSFWPLWLTAVLLSNFLLILIVSYAYINRTYKKRDAARSEWIAAVSHDVRTPLATVLGYAGALEQDSALNTAQREQAALIRSKGEELRQLIDNLNLTNRLEYSMEPLQSEWLSLAALVREVAVSYLNDEGNAAYTIDADISPCAAALMLYGDRALLRRLLINLIGNSIRHNPQGCAIRVTLAAKGRRLVLAVSDSGCGYPPEQLKRLAGKTPELSSGHGLGLTIVRQVVAAHGSKIRFSNEKNGGGMCRIVFRRRCRVLKAALNAQTD